MCNLLSVVSLLCEGLEESQRRQVHAIGIFRKHGVV